MLYLTTLWWHQFEQPFDDTAALNLWSRDRKNAPEASVCNMRMQEHSLSDWLEDAAGQLLGNWAGVVLKALEDHGVSAACYR